MKSRFMKNRLIPADRIRMSANPGKAVLAARAYCGTKKAAARFASAVFSAVNPRPGAADPAEYTWNKRETD